MKFFALVNNQYLSDKQCGIQTAHAVSEMCIEYDQDSVEGRVYTDWAINHKTVIMARGGNCITLEQHYQTLLKLAKPLKLPVIRFYEDETLNFAVTSVGIVMPSEVTWYSTQILRNKYKTLTDFTNQFPLV